MSLIRNNTPIECYRIGSHIVHVKREDLCVSPPGPPFSKCRGLYAHLQTLKSQGVRTVGYVESSVSMAGWGVAWMTEALEMESVIYDPQYVHDTPHLLLFHRRKWKQFKAMIRPVPAGRTSVNFHIAKRALAEEFGPKAMMLPIGLRFPETVDETAKEAEQTFHKLLPRSIVVCVGSGTIAAGLLKATRNKPILIYGIRSCSGSVYLKRKEIFLKARRTTNPLLAVKNPMDVIDPGWDYSKPYTGSVPFPCHPYYDRKAWKWLRDNINKVPKPVLFWNIGSQPMV